MRGKSHAAHPSSLSAGRFDGDARQARELLLGRLKALPEAIHCVPCTEGLEEQRKTDGRPILWMAEAQLATE